MSATVELPTGWAWTTLGDVTEPTVEQRGPDCNGTFAYVDISSIDRAAKTIAEPKVIPVDQAPSRARQRLCAGDVIVSMTRPNLNAVALVPPELDGATGSTGFHVLRSPRVRPNWLAYLVQTHEFISAMSALVLGVLYPAVRPKDIAAYRFALPPVHEQDRIVGEIEKQLTRLEAAVVALKRVQANLKRYRASVLKAACEGRLVPTEAELARKEGRPFEPASELLKRILQERRAKWEADQLARMRTAGKPLKDESWKTKYKEPAPPDTSNLPAPLEGWSWVSVGQVSWSVKDGPHYSPKYVEHGVPFITGGQVRPSGVDFESAKYISPELHAKLSERCKPERGDLLYTKGGTTGIARVNTYDVEFSVWVHVAVLKLVPSILPFYLQQALNSPSCYAQAQRYTHGVGNQDLGLTRMVRIVFSMPPSVEQRRIVDETDRRMSAIDAVADAVQKQLGRADRLRQSILKRAFEGKLVPQDPKDEPASVLLERIRAEHTAKAAGPQRRRPRLLGKKAVAAETT